MDEQPVIEALTQVPTWWRMVLVFAQILAYVTFALLSVFAFFAKREWNRMTKDVRDVRDALMEISLAVREVATTVGAFSTRVEGMELETRDQGKAIARVEGQLDQLVNGPKH